MESSCSDVAYQSLVHALVGSEKFEVVSVWRVMI